MCAQTVVRSIGIISIFLLSIHAFTDMLSCQSKGREGPPNTLSQNERREGWELLFNGTSLEGWRGAYRDSLPQKGWEVRDGMIIVRESGGGESVGGGDIVTVEEYGSFDLTVDFRLTDGANSGIKYFVTEQQPKTVGSAKGLEYQLLDDARHPDAKLGINGNRTLASLYDLIPAHNKVVRPIGEWNRARILVQGTHVEHWLNGVKVLEYERGGEEFLQHKALSKFKDIAGFGEAGRGHILLQDHGNTVYFRNIKIRNL